MAQTGPSFAFGGVPEDFLGSRFRLRSRILRHSHSFRRQGYIGILNCTLMRGKHFRFSALVVQLLRDSVHVEPLGTLAGHKVVTILVELVALVVVVFPISGRAFFYHDVMKAILRPYELARPLLED